MSTKTQRPRASSTIPMLLTVIISNKNSDTKIFVNPSDTIAVVKVNIIKENQLNDDDISHYQLIHDGKKLDDNKLTVADYGITREDTLHLVHLNLLSITVKTVAGKSIALEVDAYDTIANVKKMVEEREGIPTNQQRLQHGDKPLQNDSRTLSSYNIQNGYTIKLCLRAMGSMPVYIKTLAERRFKLEVELTDTIEDVKFKIHGQEEILPEKQELFLGKKLLEDSFTVLDYDIKKDSILKLVIHEPKSITIYIDTLSTGKRITPRITLTVKSSYTIRVVKEMIQGMEGIHPNQQRLTYADIHLRDCDTLSHYKIEEYFVLQLFIEKEFEWNVDNFAKEQIFDESHYGIKVAIPPLAVREGEDSINLTVKPINDEREWQTPPGFKPVSYFYKVDSSRKFDKPIDVHLEQNSAFKDDSDLVSLIRKEDSELIDSSHHPKIIDNAAVVNLSDTQNQVIAIATKDALSENALSKNALSKRFAMMLLYKHVPPTSNLMWNVKVIVTQDLGPYIERVKSDESLKDWHRQDFYTFNADLDSLLVLQSSSNKYKVTSERQPCQVNMSNVELSRVDSVLHHMFLRAEKNSSRFLKNKIEDLDLEFQHIEQAKNCTFRQIIFADKLDSAIVSPTADRKEISKVELSFTPEEEMLLLKRPTETELMQVLNQIKSKWREIGIALGVNSDNRDVIYQKHQSATCCLSDVLIIWFNDNKSVTWLTAIRAVNNEPVNKPKVAIEMKEFAIRIVKDSSKKKEVSPLPSSDPLPTNVSPQSHLQRSMSFSSRSNTASPLPQPRRLSQGLPLSQTNTPPEDISELSLMKTIFSKIHVEIPKISDVADSLPPMNLLLFQKESEK